MKNPNEHQKDSAENKTGQDIAPIEIEKFYQDIVETIHEPVLILDLDLRVLYANPNFYKTFKVQKKETTGKLFFALANHQWEIPALHELLEDILKNQVVFNDFRVEHEFSSIGRRIMIVNARQVVNPDLKQVLILVAIEDVTDRVLAEQIQKDSEERFRKAFETTKDNIVLIEKMNGQIVNSNQASQDLLGYTNADLLNMKIWELGFVKDAKDFQKDVRKLEDLGYIGYFDSMVKTKQGNVISAEIYLTNRAKVFQCNIRDITERKQSEEDVTLRLRAEKLLSGLNIASVAMSIALTPQDIFIAVAKVLNDLNINCTLFLLDDTKSRLKASYLSFQPAIVNKIEKLIGINQKSFTILVDSVDIYRKVIRENKIVFAGSSEQIIRQLLPKSDIRFAPMIEDLMQTQNQKGIFAPLIVEKEVIGVFSIQSNSLTMDDVPATSAFAYKLGGAWQKAKLLQDLKNTVEGTFHLIATISELRDSYTAGHQVRVSDLATAIATEMHLTNDQVDSIHMASLVHDIGMIKVPLEILRKPSRLNDLEFALIKAHPRDGFNLLKDIEFPWPLAQIVLQHHEKLDGSGYPNGLKGDEILVEARIIDVADIVEAMSSLRTWHRPYRIEKALAQITLEKGTLLDPIVVDACLRVFKHGYKFPSPEI